MALARAHKGYADTSAGQVHYRRLGAGPTVVLIHWTPFSGRMFEGLMPRLVQAGYCAIAFDLLGYGRSDPRPETWSIEAYGANLAEAMEACGVETASAVGGHVGGAAALELALAAPARIERVVLDGLPFLSDELKAVLSQMVAAPRPNPGGERDVTRLAFEAAVGVYREYVPGFEVTDETIEQIWPA
ncbi:MAG: alpha/beta hydrolase, partial [Pseudomonadota bacterium]